MPSYKLSYFNARGRAEPTRLMFAYGNVPYEDIRVQREEFANMKDKLPFASLPILEVDGRILPQSKALARYVAKQLKIAGKDDYEAALCDAYVDGTDDVLNAVIPFLRESDAAKKKIIWLDFEENTLKPFLARYNGFLVQNGTGYLVGSQLTWADIFIADMTSTYHGMTPLILPNYPELAQLVEKVNAIPSIKAWIDKRPKTDF